MSADGELWHIVEAKRDDGTPTMFRIRELDPLKHLPRIFVIEMPYPKTELSRLPNAAGYRRLAELEEQWLRPACTTLGWELVGSKTEDGSFFLYMYGASDPNALIEKVSPFDAGLGFYDDQDPEWQEYGTLRELLDQAKAIPPFEQQLGATPDVTIPVTQKRPVAKAKPAGRAKPTKSRPPHAKAKANAKPSKAQAKAKPAKTAKSAKRKRR